MRPRTTTALVAAIITITAACGNGATDDPTRSSSTSRPAPADACGANHSPPAHYKSVVVFSFENRQWADVGLGFGPGMPYLHRLGSQCSWFPKWTETDVRQDSLTQYVGQITGAREPGTENDCSPSRTCSTRADSLFRQLRTSGRRAVNYVEDAPAPCSAEGNAVRHVPALYLWSPDDRRHCADQVRPLRDLDVGDLPAFAFITPTECNDGHDCGDSVVDRWASKHIQPVLESAAYRAGDVAVFIWYDEDTPVPNLWITPTALPGRRSGIVAGSAATLKAWQSMLGVPCLAQACSAPDLRGPARS